MKASRASYLLIGEMVVVVWLLSNMFNKKYYEENMISSVRWWKSIMSAFNKRKDKYWFEKMSRQRAMRRSVIISSQTLLHPTHQKIWIGGLIKKGKVSIKAGKRGPRVWVTCSKNTGRITIERIRECFRLFRGTSTLLKISRKNFHWNSGNLW